MFGVIKKYFVNIAIALDQTLNAVLGGDPDETISSRLGKCKQKGNKFCIKVCAILTKIWKKFGSKQKGHCIEAIEADEGKDEIVKID